MSEIVKIGICVFILLVMKPVDIFSKHVGPPLEVMKWGEFPGKSFSFPLSDYPMQNSLVVLIVNENIWTDPMLDEMSGEISVLAPEGHGLMAVVQHLNLRIDKTNSGCRDYIMFHEMNSTMTSSKICGQLNKENKSFIPEKLIGPRVFHSASGKITLEYESEEGDDPEDWENTKQMTSHIVDIVFTAYKACEEDKLNSDIKITRCGGKCLTNVLCDENINCGFQEDFAVDESNCMDNLEEIASVKASYVLQLYLGAGLFIALILLVASFHHYRTVRRMKNIPHK